jgi:hypothetical protein
MIPAHVIERKKESKWRLLVCSYCTEPELEAFVSIHP